MVDFAEGIVVPVLITLAILAALVAGVWAVVTVAGSIALLLAYMATGADPLLRLYGHVPVGAIVVAALVVAGGLMSFRRTAG
ncbi:hypothetical protein [Prosthecomicrobium pneumaticum]|uniref:TRAP C4-dicarboxylate transport system permease DctM subunit domain-containing protein n=1 Tax=Prosthecomicrobium pneumaticum TaxID=81895 RepID=A0A7W9FMD5_9HYPH|nr:hypothetical protein [Prosthecomicrobium pneumaticum]MBB5753347.1 hypothetical protein [Prosthecomicrobium pneumaticum]